MEKIVVQFAPTLEDYSHVVRSFLTRKRSYWVSLGILGIAALSFFILAIFEILNGEFGRVVYSLLFSFLIAFVMSYPLWSGWLTIKNAQKKEQLVLPAKYELDDEKVIVVNQIAEVKYDWGMFSKAFDDGQYFFLTYSTNKNMFQFIPKRAFASIEQENMTRDLIIRHLGSVENTINGMTGWKLTVFFAVLSLLFVFCWVVTVIIVVNWL